MPNCGNCGSFVSRTYERVLKPDDCEQVRACPNCDMVRTSTGVRPRRYAQADGGESA